MTRGRIRTEAITAAKPIGTLTKKIQCQLAFSMITPPSVGPRTGASIAGTATMLITRPIRDGPAASAIISWPIGRIMPPPSPWSTRNTISSSIEVAKPHSAEPRTNSTSETSQTDFAPNRRDAQPETGITAASESM